MAGKCKSSEKFILRAIEVHGDYYDYSKVNYIHSDKHVTITCKLHGDFQQKATVHLMGRGCKQCRIKQRSLNRTKPNEDFIKECVEKHGEEYDYSQTVYTHAKNKVKIVCKDHGMFEQYASNHLQGQGCPKCSFNISKAEIELQNYIKSLGYNIISNKKNIIKSYELDIYIPELNVAIEFNGFWWHYDRRNPVCRQKGYHGLKSKTCREQGIKLLHIREDLWLNNKIRMKKVVETFLELNASKMNNI